MIAKAVAIAAAGCIRPDRTSVLVRFDPDQNAPATVATDSISQMANERASKPAC